MKILIADDSTLMRERIKAAVLEKLPNAEMFEAVDAFSAESSLKENSPDLLILDISMPGGNGLDMLKKVKAAYTMLKVIILTNYPNQKYMEKAYEYGADYFLSKFDDFSQLPDVVYKTIYN